jgi:glycosyltransferase involved in cell wall biosynthesis
MRTIKPHRLTDRDPRPRRSRVVARSRTASGGRAAAGWSPARGPRAATALRASPPAIIRAVTHRVAIDARAAARPELGGVERWTRELAARLPALRPGRYVVVRPPRALAHRAGHAWEQTVLPLRAAGAAAVLCPANLAPLAHPRTVVVIHDAAPLRRPEWYSRAYAAPQRLLLPLLARRAQRVITPSEFSRRELCELLGLAPERVSVVPGGVDTAFSPAADPAPVRAALDLPRPYVLCVASRTARKNLAALVPAARALAAEGVDVVVAGGHRPQFAAESGLDGLRLLGHVPDALLPGLYAGAEAFALPSLYEGFGLPVLEAMAAGTPVVAADAAALPETCGGAARLTPPDGDAVRAALQALLADDAERERLRAAGLERAAAFSWDATARGVDAAINP